MIIYQLIDPRDNLPKYIGFTSKSVPDRIKDHYHEKGNTPKNQWIRKLRKLGLKPNYRIIEDFNDSNWQEREKYWIALHKQVGLKLKNTLPGGVS